MSNLRLLIRSDGSRLCPNLERLVSWSGQIRSLGWRYRRSVILGDRLAAFPLHLIVKVFQHIFSPFAVMHASGHFLQRHIENVEMMQLAIAWIAS